MSIPRLTLQTSIADHHSILDVATDTSVDTRKLEDKLDALVNLTTTVAEARHLKEYMASNSHQFSLRNDVIIIRGVHDVATYTSVENRNLKGKLDALVNLTTTTAKAKHLIEKMASNSQQFGARNDAILAVDQKSASFAKVFGIHSSNDHHTNVCLSLQQSVVNEHPELFNLRNYAIVIRGVHDVATDTSAEIRCSCELDTSAETRKLEGKLDALVNLISAKKDRHLYGGHWKNGYHRLFQQRQTSDSQLADSPSS
ncbi:hypothetical protein Fmac_008353 [Flemingia macrophylla]|uniref:Uncharacterized protein n=1 Tax=Flemingia macrophylla TaxID=520843 RepID=A0ABD1MYC5_9FABA